MELVVCGVPFGEPNEKEALGRVKACGFTSVQIYTHWRDMEPAARGRFDWAALDRNVRAIQDAGMKFVPFLLMGPKYSAPDWWLADARHVGLKCLEHGKESPIESVWNAAFRIEITRVMEAFAAHYLPWNVLESVQPGICGDYGEALFPALGNWPGDYHTHRGFWCGGDDAVALFRKYLEREYGTLDRLNAAWRSHYAALAEVRPFLRSRAPSRTAFFDMVAWYRESMTEYSEFWMAECRRIFPALPAYLCTGGADDEITAGALFAGQAKAAAKHAGGIRLTNEVNKFYENFRLTAHTQAACDFYGAYLGLEPVGPITTQGIVTRMFGSAAYGNRQMFHYYGNVFGRKGRPAVGPESAAAVTQYAPLLIEQKVERGIAFFWPLDQAVLDNAIPDDARAALLHIRRRYPVTPVSEQMILNGALDGYGCLVMMSAASTRASVLRRIARWVTEEGGRLVASGLCRDLELEPVEEFDALFGIGKDSEEAWGHTQAVLRPAAGFDKLAAIPEIHIERGWMGLADGVEQIALAAEHKWTMGHARGQPVSPLFRRTFGERGQAIFYCGPISFQRDPQAAHEDPCTIVAILDDVCAMSGVRPLGTADDEIARARVGGRLLVLREGAIDVRPDNP